MRELWSHSLVNIISKNISVPRRFDNCYQAGKWALPSIAMIMPAKRLSAHSADCLSVPTETSRRARKGSAASLVAQDPEARLFRISLKRESVSRRVSPLSVHHLIGGGTNLRSLAEGLRKQHYIVRTVTVKGSAVAMWWVAVQCFVHSVLGRNK